MSAFLNRRDRSTRSERLAPRRQCVRGPDERHPTVVFPAPLTSVDSAETLSEPLQLELVDANTYPSGRAIQVYRPRND